MSSAGSSAPGDPPVDRRGSRFAAGLTTVVLAVVCELYTLIVRLKNHNRQGATV